MLGKKERGRFLKGNIIVPLIIAFALVSVNVCPSQSAYADENAGAFSVFYFLDGEPVYDADTVPAGWDGDWQLLGLPSAPDGYMVCGWYLDPECGGGSFDKISLPDSSDSSGSVNVYADTVARQYDIYYVLGGYEGLAFENDADNPDTYSAADVKDGPVTINSPPAQGGFTFKGWAEGADGIPQGASGPMTFTAVWENIVSPQEAVSVTGDMVVTVTSNGQNGSNIRFDVSVYTPDAGEYTYPDLISEDINGDQVSGTFEGFLNLSDGRAVQISVHGNELTGVSPAFAYAGGSGGAVAVTDEILYHTVTFLDFDGSFIDRQRVARGSGAEAPDSPVREGYTFTGWDGGFADVTENLTVTALYEPDKNDDNGGAVVDESGGGDSGDNIQDGDVPGSDVPDIDVPDVVTPAPTQASHAQISAAAPVFSAKAPVSPPAAEAQPQDGPPTVAPETTTIQPEPTPLVSPLVWGLSNLILTVATGIIAFGLIVGYFIRRKNEQEEYTQGTEKYLGLRLVAVAATVVSALLYSQTDGAGNTIELTDRWTLWHLAILAGTIVIAFIVKEKYETEEVSITNW